MKFSILPREKAFYDLLERLGDKADQSVKLFRTMIDGWSPAHEGVQQLRDLEHDCDMIVHEVKVRLNKTFVTPLDREDIHLLSSRIDDVVDLVHALTERMVLFNIEIVNQEVKELTHILEKASALMAGAIHHLRNHRNFDAIQETCILIHTLENEGDRAYEKALGNLFKNGIEPLEVIKWKEIYDFLERAIDKCEDVADILWGIVVKYG